MFKFNTYKGSERQSQGKKASFFILDFIFMTILIFATIMFAVGPILSKNQSYIDTTQSVKNRAEELYSIQALSGLSIKDEDKGILDDRRLFDKYVDMNIQSSYEKNTKYFNDNSIFISSLENKATYDNDLIAYYIVNFKPSNNIKLEVFGEKSAKSYFISFIQSDATISTYFDVNGEEFPTLKGQVAVSLYQYLNGDANSSPFYANLFNWFVSINRNCLIELQNYVPYKTSYDLYIKDYKHICSCQNIGLISAYTFIFLLYFCLPQILIGNGVTLGRFICKTRVVYNSKTPLCLFLSLIINYLANCFILSLIGLFTFGFASFTFPLWGFIDINVLSTLSFGLVLIDFVLMTFLSSKKGLFEIVSFSEYVVYNKIELMEE